MQSFFVVQEFLRSGCILPASPGSADRVIVAWGDPIRTGQASMNSDELSVFAPDFFLRDECPWWVFRNFCTMSRSDLATVLETWLGLGGHAHEGLEFEDSIPWVLPELSSFRSVFVELQSKFRTGFFKKVVPVVFEIAEWRMNELRKAQLVRQILDYTKRLPVSVYGVWNTHEGILGATPEILFCQKSDSIWETAALAGTQVRRSSSSSSGDSENSLMKDPKELEEHRIVIDGIRASLAGLGSLTVGKMEELSLPTLTHLLTPIELQVNSKKTGAYEGEIFSELVKRLHPTPALGGFPKEKAMDWLRSFEELDSTLIKRRRFGAPFGATQGSQKSACWVSIRNLQWHESDLMLGAGCGLISASHLSKEWRELQAKRSAVKKMFNLASDIKERRELTMEV